MFASMKRLIKWGAMKKTESPRNQQTLHLLTILNGVLEDILFWKRMWLSLSFILFLNALFFLCINKQITILDKVLYLGISYLIIDAFEAWLKYKHRTTCLKRLADHDSDKLSMVTDQVKRWLQRKWVEFMYLRQTNHTKAFILVNMILGVVLLLGKYLGGYMLFYVLCMTLCTFYKVAPPVIRIARKIQQNADSDMEFEGLIPEVTEGDIKLLSIEPEQNQIFDERQSLDYWKPDDVPIEEVSDSSDNSSSLVTNLSMDKMHTLDNDVETSDSSDDEYIPIEKHKDHLQSTVEVIEPTATWSSSAYSALWNFTGAVSNMIYTNTKLDVMKRKRVASADSSDGFEIVDKQDLM